MDFTSDITASPVKRAAPLSDLSRESSISSELLTEDEKKRLQLQELKETLLVERDQLWDEEVQLRRQLDNLERDRFMQGISSSDSSDLDHSDEEEEEEEEVDEPPINGNKITTEDTQGIDTNAAKIFLDLMLLSSKKEMLAEPRPKPIHIDGGSTLQEELSVKYDTLPLLNMKLRLKYLQRYLYPHVDLRVTDLDDEDNRNRYEVIAKFRRNRETPFQVKFKIDYDNNIEDKSNGQLTHFEIVQISNKVRLCFERLLYEDGQLLLQNPVTLLFFCLEFDRLTSDCDKLISEIKTKFQNRLRYSQDIKDVELKFVKLQELRIPSEKEFIIKFEITIDKAESYSKGKKIISFLYPQLKIHLTLRQEGKEIKDPDINNIFQQLLSDYELNTALVELISSLMFL